MKLVKDLGQNPLAKVYLAIGSNLDRPMEQVLQAIKAIQSHLTQFRSASLYRTPPIGPAGQPDYINTVVEGHTNLKPIPLLDLCQQIEANHNRIREIPWGPRTLDIDILYYDDQYLETERLKLPHPEILNRGFVVIPLLDLIESTYDPLGRELDITRYNRKSMELVK